MSIYRIACCLLLLTLLPAVLVLLVSLLLLPILERLALAINFLKSSNISS